MIRREDIRHPLRPIQRLVYLEFMIDNNLSYMILSCNLCWPYLMSNLVVIHNYFLVFVGYFCNWVGFRSLMYCWNYIFMVHSREFGTHELSTWLLLKINWGSNLGDTHRTFTPMDCMEHVEKWLFRSFIVLPHSHHIFSKYFT